MNNGVIPPGKILIIDDDEEDYLILRNRLRDTSGMKWAIDWASTYEQASEKLFGPGISEGAYQAVVVDYHIGLHSGLDLIRKAGEKNLDAPFILITGQGNLDVDEEALRAGASLYLTKEEANSALLERTIRYAIELRQKEVALKMSERQLRSHAALVDHMHDAVVASDANYLISSWNPAAELLYGWKAEEVMGHPGLDLLQTQFPNPDKMSMLKAIAEMGYWRGEVTQVKRTGERFPVEVSSIVQHDEQGKIIGYLSVNRDITDRKIAEARIAAEQEWLRTTLVSIGDAVITCNPQGTVTFLNPVAEEITGWSNEEAAGQPLDCVFKIINEQTRERQGLPLALVLEDAQVVGLPGQSALLRRDGRMIPIEDSAAPIRDPRGDVLGVVIVFQDVSARRESERTLREAEERFRIALSNSSIAVFSTDLNLRYTWFYSTSMGSLPAKMIGYRDDEILPLEQVAEFIEVKRRVIETRSVVRDEVQVALTDDLMVLDVSIEPLISKDGEMVGTIGACFNVTEQRKLEAESQEHITEMEVHHRLLEYREKERQGIARDLHDGPVQDLSGLLFNIQFTKDAIKDAAIRLDLEQIGGSIKEIIRDLRSMINELRPPSLIRFGVTRAIQLHAEDFMEKHPEIDIELILRPVEGESRLSEAIDLTVFRIYQEAMTNIARHALATKVSVRFNKLNDYVILEVRDNGKGFSIASGLAEHTQRDHYGLAGMRERADAVGGQFSVISEPGEGTIIHVAIPLSGGIHS